MLRWNRFVSSLLVAALCLSILPNQVFAANEASMETLSTATLDAIYDADTGEVTVSIVPTGASYLILAGYLDEQMVFVDVAKELFDLPVKIKVPFEKKFDTLKVFCLDSTHTPITEAQLVYSDVVNECAIDYVDFVKEISQFEVTVSSVDNCVLQLQIIDDATGSILHSSTIMVTGMIESQVISYVFEDYDLPNYFALTASLLDEAGNLLCDDYTYLEQTQRYQDAANKTIADFDAAKLINFDEAVDNNFLIASEDTQILDLADSYSIEKDTELGSITIHGSIDTLDVDQTYNKYMIIWEEEVFLVNATSISVTDNSVTFIENTSAELIDFVDFVKIDQQAIGVCKETEDHIELLGDDDVGGIETGTFAKIEICLQASEDSKYKVSAEGNSTLHLNILIDKENDIFVFDAKFTNMIKLGIAAVAEGEQIIDDTVEDGNFGTLELGHVEYPIVSGIKAYADVKLPVVLEVVGQAQFSYEVMQETRFKYDFQTNKWSKQKLQDAVPSVETEIEATFETGLEMTIGIGFLESLIKENEYTFSVSGTISALFIVTLGKSAKINASGISHHCVLCLDGGVDFELAVKLTLSFFITEKIKGDLMDVKLINFTFHLKDFYVSLLNTASSVHGGVLTIGNGKCPNIVYDTGIFAIDMYGNVYSKPLEVVGTFKMSDKQTDSIYQSNDTLKLSEQLSLYNGSYRAATEIGGIRYARKFSVEGKPQNINLLEYTLTGKAEWDDLGSPVSDAAVTVFTFSGETVAQTVTGQKGSILKTFTIPVGDKVLYAKIEKIGFIPYYVGLSIPNETGVLKLDTVSVEYNNDLSSSSFAGIVQDVFGNTLSDVTVELLDSTGAVVHTTKTDSMGVYQLTTVLSNGQYYLNYKKTGFMYDQVIPMIKVEASPITSYVTVTMKTEAQIDGHTVTGVVCDTAGDLLQGVSINLLASDGACINTVQTAANGVYTFSNVTDGVYTIVGTKDGYENTSVSVSVNGSSVTVPTISMKKSSADFTVTHEILGDILALSATNEAVGGVQLCNNVGTANWTVTGAASITKTGDWFDITQIDNIDGSTNLQISVKGYTLSRNSGTITFTKADGSTQTVNIYQKAHSLSGTVVDTNGPVAGASVIIWNTDGFRSDPIITGADGKFSSTVYDAWYSITVTTDTYGEKTIDVPTAVNMCDVDAGEIMVAEADIVASGTCGNDLTWSLTADGLLTICGTGSMSYSSYYVPWEAYLEDIISVAVENGVTSIEDNAFRECENLTNVSLADTVTIIGSYAFENCFSLPAITIPGSVTTIEEHAFDDCDSLTSIVIPDSVITIGEGAFYICDELISVTIGAGVESIGLGAFDCGLESITVVPANQYYSSLGTVLFNKDQTELIKYAGDWEINWQYDVPDGVVTIAENAFAHANRLDRITIPTSVASIGQSALNALNLEEIQVDDTNAYYCSIDGVLFNKAQTELIEYPGGNDRTEYTIPDGVTEISDYAFDRSYNLIKVVIPESVTTIGEYVFRRCRDLTTANIPDSVTTVGEGIFMGCSNLVIVDIPKGITSISDRMYYGCSGLTSIIIPNNITTIGDSAFEWCDNLQSVTIGSNVTFIDSWAFDDCDNLTSIYFAGNAPEIGDWYPFDEEVVTLYYVEGTTGWTDSDAYDAESGTWNGYKLAVVNP